MSSTDHSNDDDGLDSLEARFQKTPFQSPPPDLRALCIVATASGAQTFRRGPNSQPRLLQIWIEWFKPNPFGWTAIGMAWVAAFGFWVASTVLVPSSIPRTTPAISKETERLAANQRIELMVYLRSEGLELPGPIDRPKRRSTKSPHDTPRSTLTVTNRFA